MPNYTAATNQSLNMTPFELGWITGIIEGEGCIGVPQKGSVRVQVQMTDLDVIRRCRDTTGIGRLYGPYTNGPHKLRYQWVVGHRRDTYALLKAIQPHLGIRRATKAAEAIAHLEKKYGAPENQEQAVA